MDYNLYFDRLKEFGQEHILRFWSRLNTEQKANLLAQIDSIDFTLLNKLISQTKNTTHSKELTDLTTADIFSLSDREKYDTDMIKAGNEVISQGRVAAFLVAGGQGSRLGFNGPKGIYPITPVKKKSLFQLHAEKILAISKKNNVVIPWYIMTSVSNHEETGEFFYKNKYFGFDKNDIMFFKQDMLPAVDKNGKIILDEIDHIFMSPNGHGGSIKAIWDSGALKDMKKRHIDYLFYFQVDNVLTYICDPAFIGYHTTFNSQMSSKVLRKADPEEKVGIICKINGKTGVVEYSDLSKEEAYAKDQNGDLKFWAGSIAIHIIDTAFIEKENLEGFKLPYHIAEKNIPYLDDSGKRINPNAKNGYKFETFVFDALQHCDKTISLEVKREEEFSALKNKTGVDSKETAVRDMKKLYINWLEEAGIPVGKYKDELPAVEISPLFANNKEELKYKSANIPKFKDYLYLE